MSAVYFDCVPEARKRRNSGAEGRRAVSLARFKSVWRLSSHLMPMLGPGMEIYLISNVNDPWSLQQAPVS